MAKVPNNRIEELAASGELELNMMLDVEPHPMSVGDYFKALERQTGEAFAVSEEWKAEILPYVERILAKKNWGITDEQVIMYMVGSHLVQCGVIALGMRKNNNSRRIIYCS